jgi:hypothetical protein
MKITNEMNNNFCKQYTNETTVITDGLTHAMALKILTLKREHSLVSDATVTGYRNAVAGYYDKYWRYETHREPEYLQGVQAAINNGACIEHFIEVAAACLPSRGAA